MQQGKKWTFDELPAMLNLTLSEILAEITTVREILEKSNRENIAPQGKERYHEMEQGRLLNMKDLEQMLGVSFKSIYKWIKQGEFPKQIKFGTASRWHEEEVKEWLRTRPCGAYGEAELHERTVKQ